MEGKLSGLEMGRRIPHHAWALPMGCCRGSPTNRGARFLIRFVQGGKSPRPGGGSLPVYSGLMGISFGFTASSLGRCMVKTPTLYSAVSGQLANAGLTYASDHFVLTSNAREDIVRRVAVRL